MKYKEPCGCTHDGRAWLSMCDACAAEFNALHERAAREHRGEPEPTTTDPDPWS